MIVVAKERLRKGDYVVMENRKTWIGTLEEGGWFEWSEEKKGLVRCAEYHEPPEDLVKEKEKEDKW